MDAESFRKHGHELVDWMADYFAEVENYPVMPQVKPGDILKQLPKSAPQSAEGFDDIFKDFKDIIMPGMTHWESPNFMAYFPANKSKASVLAEMLMSTLGAQCMVWLTSPAAAELEEQMMEWLREMIGLSENFTGVIQDTASTATLSALITARERATKYQINEKGFKNERFVIYASKEIHSSIDKAVKIAGFGIEQLRKIEVDEHFALKPEVLKEQIQADIKLGLQPLAVVSAIGTTSTTAIDPIAAIGAICEQYNLWHHVDAAYAGTALVLPEMRWMAEGVESADSFVFNPHKWMFTNFDCTAYFVKDPSTLVNTFAIMPDYLKTSVDDEVKNYRDWGIPLGRRFRALKLWFVIREMGVEGIQEKIRKHIALGKWLAEQVNEHKDFELLAPVPLNTVCFRYKSASAEKLADINKEIMNSVNATGKLFFTQTSINGMFALRLAFGNTNLEAYHVENAWNLIQEKAVEVMEKYA
ncbi:pyridoxal phosphate-dependent decarboxylase family protein [Roseivirga pacifica]|uniref:pyridoxal phosphate-dependent decarboxylase family protein n=1 Tax=Roseivirga pacifica TaxID=1267423 RepID=UPI00209444ED|nr:aminotransferase class V-fold PLP-dependent enzyme [Roseivirga pacifica]MCO6359240.1 aminotransferase class V-fold PLP-dependent enzyme [Roseivirga pacifica]MCO6365124.1 aminotransferase class V-fold PLP-dependent enzyme [Roseivirga pacifica]MCO6372146.1 aminotransferase class V-fold PLP-dependent enzyme [Roseivirga pacifica]MCO6375743.1 aminotransferase class V-fold PLP-dependent enzyme [Roseivirga pacifica]MCO6379524.1 aminotransferase class V-fold PLP-dependent enzyme [Roseivirga pacific